MVLARIEGNRPPPYELPIGDRLPLRLGARTALAACMSAEEIDEFLPGPTISSEPTALRETTTSSATASRTSASAASPTPTANACPAWHRSPPVLNADGTAVAAVQAASHLEDIPPERIEQLGIEVQRTAFDQPTRILTSTVERLR